MTLTIGARTLDPRQPDDLAAAIAATGLSLTEAGVMLARSPRAGDQARALHPFIAQDPDAPDLPELARMIADAADPDIGAAIAALYPAPARTEVQLGGE